MASERKGLILLVEDTALLARSYIQYLRNEPYTVDHVATGDEALAYMAANTPDCILLDLELPDMTGLDIMDRIGTDGIMPCPVIMITAHGSINIAVDAMRRGAIDFIIKPFNADRLIITLRNTFERLHLSEIVKTYREQIDRTGLHQMVGNSLAMQVVYRTIESTATSKATIFIKGESGTGKELCAQAIHTQSPRHEGPFIALNCAAIPKELMESEIFGHVKGSFTGAISDRDGAASAANGGTLFLDEICEMDINLQSKLLRFLQSETFQRVGSTTTESVDIRILCATNRDPMQQVRDGLFREDLYYRLHVIPLELPPLRERDDDVILLATEFLKIYGQQENKEFTGLSMATKAMLLEYSWPGNVRELQNVMRQIVVLNDGGEVVPKMLPPLSSGDRVMPAVGGAPGTSVAGGRKSSKENAGNTVDTDDLASAEEMERLAAIIQPIAEMEREAIEKAIKLCDGKIRVASILLGISHATLYRKINFWKSKDSTGD
jgi:two-component system repressor protein LuxO